jgi:prophage regulatory protein
MGAIRRSQLRELVPLSDTTIYEMEQRGEFPRRFYLTSRCAAWDLKEVLAWLERRRAATGGRNGPQSPAPDVRLRKTRPVR